MIVYHLIDDKYLGVERCVVRRFFSGKRVATWSGHGIILNISVRIRGMCFSSKAASMAGRRAQGL